MRFSMALRWIFPPLLILFHLCGLHGLTQGSEACREREPAVLKSAKSMVQSTWPIRSTHDPVSRFIESLGRRLVEGVCPGESLAWSFHVIRDLDLKAFSVKGCSVFVSDGAVVSVGSESELAAVLAHEIGHHLAGHFLDSENSGGPRLGNNLFVFFSEMGASTRDAATITTGSLKQIDSPQREYEADEQAVVVLHRSEYNPQGLLDLIHRLRQGGTLSHPSERISRIEKLLERKIPGGRYISDSDSFRKIRDKIQKDWKDLDLCP
ncbi:MAG: M48 family metalloprotease [Desulfacinum sp.]|nr:M48 family metalloprotease [Desulfacinum sp.]